MPFKDDIMAEEEMLYITKIVFIIMFSTIILAALSPIIALTIENVGLTGIEAQIANQIPLFLWLTLFAALGYGMMLITRFKNK